MVVEDLDLNVAVTDDGATEKIANIKEGLRDLPSEKTVDVRVDADDDLDKLDLESVATVEEADVSEVEPVEVEGVLDINKALRSGFETSSAFKRANGSGTSFVRRSDELGIQPAPRDEAVGDIREVLGTVEVDAVLDADDPEIEATVDTPRTSQLPFISQPLKEGFEVSDTFLRDSGAGTPFVRRLDDGREVPASADSALRDVGNMTLDVGVVDIEGDTVNLRGDMSVTTEDVDIDSEVTSNRSAVSAGGASSENTGTAMTSGGQLMPAQFDLGLGDGIDRNAFVGERMSATLRGEPSEDGILRNSLDLQFNDLYAVLAKLVPTLFTVIGAMPALIGGMVALTGAAIAAAGALYAVGGLGVLGVGLEDGEFQMENFEPLVERLRDTFVESFGPLANDVEPLIRDAVGVAETVLPDVARAVEPAVNSITADLRTLMGIAGDALPMFARRISQVAASFVPMFIPLVESLLTSGVFAQIAQFGGDVLPTIALLGTAVANALPGLLALSRGFLRAVTGLALLIGGMVKFINIIDNLIPLPVLRLLGTTIGLFFIYTSFVLAARAATSGFIVNMVAAGKAFLVDYVPGVTAGTTATLAFTAAATVAVGVLTFGLAPILGAIGGGFGSLSSEIDGATESLRKFGLQSNRIGGSKFGGMGGFGGGSPTVDNRSYEVAVTNNIEGSSGDGKRLRFENERTWDSIFTGQTN